MPGNLVILSTLADLATARRVVQRLEGSGIPAFLSGAGVALASNEPGRARITIEVAAEDLEPALRVLAEPSEPETGIQARPGEPPPASSSETSTDGPVTLEVYFDPLEAYHSAELLRRRGIPCEVRGVSGGILPGLGPGVTSLRLEVQEEDLDRACEVLGFSLQGPSEDEAAEPTDKESQTAFMARETPSSRSPGDERLRPAPERPRDPVSPTPSNSPPEPTDAPASDRPSPFEVPVSLDDGSGEGSLGWVLPVLLLAGGLAWLVLRLLLTEWSH